MKSDEVRLTYDLTYKDVVDILKIIDDSSSEELHLELGDLKLDVIKGKTSRPPIIEPVPVPGACSVQAQAPAVSKEIPVEQEKPRADAGKQTAADLSGIPIHSPLSGTFYRAPAPGAPPFVKEGAAVKAGDQVAIVEVMKLMNSIRAPQDGIIKEILVENESQVAMGQALMLMDPPKKKRSKKKSK